MKNYLQNNTIKELIQIISLNNQKKLWMIMLVCCFFTFNALAQPTLSKSFNPSTIGPGNVSTVTFVITNGSGSPVMDLAFTDVLPANVTLSDPVIASTTCLDGVVSAPSGGGTITFSDGRLGGGQTCYVTVHVTSSIVGMHTNPAVTLSSSAGSSMSLPVDLTVSTSFPSFSKSFSPTSVDLGETSTLTFVIDNSLNSSMVLNPNFGDNLPLGLVVASPANVISTCASSITITAVPGSNSIAMGGAGVINAGENCYVSVEVEAVGTGIQENKTNDLFITLISTPQSSGQAVASIEVTRGDPVHISKSFISDPIFSGETVDLEFTIKNFDRNNNATNITFMDDLDAVLSGLVVLAPLPTNPCGTGSSLSGTSTLTLTGGNLSSNGGECTFNVTCQVPAAAAAGTYTNNTTAVTCDQGTGNVATANLFVEDPPLITFTKEFIGDPVAAGQTVDIEFNITNDDPINDLTGILFDDDLSPIFGSFGDPEYDEISNNCNGTIIFHPNHTLPSPPFPNFFANGAATGIRYQGGTLAANSSCSIIIRLQVPNTLSGGTYTNTTTDLTGNLDGNAITVPPATDDLRVLYAPIFSKSFDPQTVAPGETLDLTFTINYNGGAPNDLTNITFTDDLSAFLAGATAILPPNPDPPCGAGSSLAGSAGNTLLTFTGGTLSPGDVCSFTITLDIPAGTSPGNYTNTTSNITATNEGQTVTGSVGEAELVVTGLAFTKEYIGSPAISGEIVTLEFTIDNTASALNATNLIFTDLKNQFPPGTTIITSLPLVDPCGIGSSFSQTASTLLLSNGSVAGGSSCTFSIQLELGGAVPNGDYSNATSNLSASIDGNPISLPPAVDVLTIDDQLLGISKEFINDPILPGGSVQLEFTLENIDATRIIENITFTDDLDAMISGTVFSSIVNNSCGSIVTGIGTGLITFSGGTLAPSSNCSFTVNVDIPAAVSASNNTNTTSTIMGDVGGTPVSGGTATDELRVRTLSLEKSFNGTGVGGGTVTLSFTLQNLDASNQVTDINFTDDLSAMLTGTTVLSLPNDVSDCGELASIGGTGTSTLSFLNGDLGEGGSCTFEITVQLPCVGLSGIYTNTTSDVTGSGFEGQITAPPATADLMFTAAAAATFTRPSDITIECDESTDPSNTGDVTNESHVCCTGLNANYSDASTKTNDGSCSDFSYTITRTWTLVDCNGFEALPQTQTITVEDSTDPTVNCPPTETVDCDGDMSPVATGMATGMDNCDSNPMVTFTDSDDQTNDGSCTDFQYTIIRTWKAIDACGNESATCDQTINVVDSTSPFSISCPPTETVDCDSDMSPASTGTATGMDNCDPSPVATFTDSDNQTSDGSCTNFQYTITRTWKVTDACGNESATCDQTINVVDMTDPTVTCPAATTVDCDGDMSPAATGTATGMDNCDASPVVSSTDASTKTSDGSCTDFSYVITRTWKVTDACGNESATCDQTITVEDTTIPTVTCPAATTVECDESTAPSNTGTATGMDNCDASPVVSSTDASMKTSDGSCTDFSYVITRTWKATDACGNESATCDQTITVEDTTIPTVTCPGAITIECDESTAPSNTGTASGMDNCDASPVVSSTDANTKTSDGSCTDFSYVITRTWKVTDACGNESATCDQTITVVDMTIPTVTCPGAITIECDESTAPSNTGTASGMDNCDSSPVASSTDASTKTSDGSCTDFSYVITRTWKVTDACGNESATCDQTITVEDTTPPIAACQNITITLNSNGEWNLVPADVFDAVNSSDNCGTAAPIALSKTYFSCLNEGPNTVTLTVEDECGNPATCTAIVTVEEFLVITNITATPELCAGAGNGTITISATAGGGQIGYSIDGGVNFQFGGFFTNLTPGTYNIVVKVFGVPAICEKTGTVTVGTSNNPQTWYKDADNDGYSDGNTQLSCTQPTGYKLQADLLGPEIDCNDNNPLLFPGQVWYKDADNDGYGITPTIIQCQRPTGYKAASELIEIDTDCNDNNSAIHPGATEVCNGIDDNCDVNIDEGLSGETYVGNVSFTSQAQIDAWPACYSVINGNVTISGFGVNNLGPLSNLEEITGNIFIQNTSLPNLTGLNGLTTIGGALTIYFNSSLTSLNGLGSVVSVGGNLSIYYNFSLSDCCAIVDLINGGVTGSVVIFFNAVGCNSVANINANCPGNNPIVNPDDNIAQAEANCKDCVPPSRGSVIGVFPNPASDKLNVLFSGSVESGSMELIDVIGRKVFTYKITENNNIQQIDVKGFNKGMYILSVKTEGHEPVAKRVVIE